MTLEEIPLFRPVDPTGPSANASTAPDGLALLLEQLPCTLWSTNEQLQVTWSVGGAIPDFVPAGHPAETAHRQALTGNTVEYETEIEGRVFRARVMPLRSSTGAIVGCLGTAFDITEQRAAEEALRRNRELLAAVTEGTTDAVFVKDLEGRYLLVNDATARFLGRPASEVVGRDDHELLEPESAARVVARDRRIIESGAIHADEEEVSIAGTQRTFLSTKGPHRDHLGNVIALVGVSRDITDRKRAEVLLRLRTEERLRHQNALLRLAQLRMHDVNAGLDTTLETAADALDVERCSYWSLSVDGNAIDCQRLFRRSARGFDGGGRLEASTYPRYFSALRSCETIDANDAPADGRTSEFREGYFDVHGITSMLDVPVWREGALAGVVCLEHVGPPRAWTSAEQDFARAIANVVSVLLETSARAHAEELYRLIATATGEVVRDWDLATDHLEWSGELSAVFGHELSAAAASGEWWLAQVHPGDCARVDESVRALRAGTASAWSTEYRFLRGDGSSAHVFDRGFITRDDRGVAVRMTGAMQDITEKKELEARVHLADHMVSMGTIAAGVAHEINNPLAYIQANLEYAIEHLTGSTTLDASVLEALDDARLGAGRVRDIVRDLKTFSRPDDGPDGVVDVDAVVNSSASIAMNEIRHRARFTKKLGQPPRARGTEARLGQVMVNLLVNAAQAIPEGAAEKNSVRVETGVVDDRVFIDVSDTGAGIPPEMLTRIFDPFFTTKPVGIGTGLGLPICHSILTALGGDISVDSVPGRGTRFRVTLPTAADASEASSVSVSATAAVRRSRILVVDDEPAIRGVVKRILGKEHEVMVAESGRAALHLLADQCFDVVLFDLMMPEGSGVELYEGVRVLHPDLLGRLGVLTGGAFTPEASAFLARCKLPLVEKPFSTASLNALIARILEERPCEQA